jgi:hypothetical protein
MRTGVAIQTSNYDWDNVNHSTKKLLLVEAAPLPSVFLGRMFYLFSLLRSSFSLYKAVSFPPVMSLLLFPPFSPNATKKSVHKAQVHSIDSQMLIIFEFCFVVLLFNL